MLRSVGSHRCFAALFLAALLALHAFPHEVHAIQFRRVSKVPTIANHSFKILPPANMLDSAASAQFLPDTTDPRNVAKNEWVIKNVVKTSACVTAVYVRRINGLEVMSGDINLNIVRVCIPSNGQVTSIGDSFYRGARPSQPNVDALSAAAPPGLSSDGVQPPVGAFKSLAVFVGSPSPTTVHVEPAPTSTDQTGTSDKAPPTATAIAIDAL
ncbi:hypothetical protein AMAG_11102 [Allomyces macrogynus ATCC 38327]|uniref:FTP domain-containing protein n=1 Tax=Allomyces macrogynus (strain ATCC 38327) TaxID=578462 RepID=A0A0L0SSK7_ALLM3|nr:hypothetical protein AMAG_11102 [Allomyces macrogynus ATCC 38327]|eukprot:KNE65482.1 hypothetical protein AMAG_11102 [Allomyces macrogynus ATCC 38327]